MAGFAGDKKTNRAPLCNTIAERMTQVRAPRRVWRGAVMTGAPLQDAI